MNTPKPAVEQKPVEPKTENRLIAIRRLDRIETTGTSCGVCCNA